MAYFPNSSAGAALDVLCDKCVHLGPEDGPGCALLGLQLIWNYSQIGDTAEAKTQKSALDVLIPDTKESTCTMFFPIEWLSDRGKFEIGKADQEAKDRLKLEEWNALYRNGEVQP